MSRSTLSLLQACKSVDRCACSVAVRAASLSTGLQFNTYYGYWFSHWRA